MQYSGLSCFATATSITMSLRALALLGLASLAAAAPNMKPSASTVNKRYLEERNGVTYNVFKRAGETSSLSYVKNSGICETTPGVDQYSGYLDVGTDMHSKQISPFGFYQDFSGFLPRFQLAFALFWCFAISNVTTDRLTICKCGTGSSRHEASRQPPLWFSG